MSNVMIPPPELDPRLRDVVQLAQMLFRDQGDHIMVVYSNARGTQWVGCCPQSERMIALALADGLGLGTPIDIDNGERETGQ